MAGVNPGKPPLPSSIGSVPATTPYSSSVTELLDGITVKIRKGANNVQRERNSICEGYLCAMNKPRQTYREYNSSDEFRLENRHSKVSGCLKTLSTYDSISSFTQSFPESWDSSLELANVLENVQLSRSKSLMAVHTHRRTNNRSPFRTILQERKKSRIRVRATPSPPSSSDSDSDSTLQTKKPYRRKRASRAASGDWSSKLLISSSSDKLDSVLEEISDDPRLTELKTQCPIVQKHRERSRTFPLSPASLDPNTHTSTNFPQPTIKLNHPEVKIKPPRVPRSSSWTPIEDVTQIRVRHRIPIDNLLLDRPPNIYRTSYPPLVSKKDHNDHKPRLYPVKEVSENIYQTNSSCKYSNKTKEVTETSHDLIQSLLVNYKISTQSKESVITIRDEVKTPMACYETSSLTSSNFNHYDNELQGNTRSANIRFLPEVERSSQVIPSSYQHIKLYIPPSYPLITNSSTTPSSAKISSSDSLPPNITPTSVPVHDMATQTDDHRSTSDSSDGCTPALIDSVSCWSETAASSFENLLDIENYERNIPKLNSIVILQQYNVSLSESDPKFISNVNPYNQPFFSQNMAKLKEFRSDSKNSNPSLYPRVPPSAISTAIGSVNRSSLFTQIFNNIETPNSSYPSQPEPPSNSHHPNESPTLPTYIGEFNDYSLTSPTYQDWYSECHHGSTGFQGGHAGGLSGHYDTHIADIRGRLGISFIKSKSLLSLCP